MSSKSGVSSEILEVDDYLSLPKSSREKVDAWIVHNRLSPMVVYRLEWVNRMMLVYSYAVKGGRILVGDKRIPQPAPVVKVKCLVCPWEE